MQEDQDRYTTSALSTHWRKDRRRQSAERSCGAHGRRQERDASGTPGAQHDKPDSCQITNNVVINDSANATLAVGASPIMATNPRDVADLSKVIGALLINFGWVPGWDLIDAVPSPIKRECSLLVS